MLELMAALAMAAQTPDSEIVDWVAQGEATLEARKAVAPITGPAKNVILFVADGMDITTVTAGRIYVGQKAGKAGEEHVLSFETFPHVALAKTYTTNMQTADSAGTATAMLTGHKTKSGVINVDQTVPRADCAASQGKGLPSIIEYVASTGRVAGVVSTARITHATPATLYAVSPDRDWEADTDLPQNADDCVDIAQQLITTAAEKPLKLAFGGGRRAFLPSDTTDPEYDNQRGKRGDDKDLTADWRALSPDNKYVWNAEGFNALTPGDAGAILGLFEPSHMQYEGDRAEDGVGEPSLAEMTTFAIDHLSADEDGFFLVVEGGRVDHAHHAGNAYRALEDVAAFDAAIAAALEKTTPEETLIIVTADHGHTMALQGYPQRGNPILGVVKSVGRDGAPSDRPYPAADGKPYTTLAYANGPGSPFARPHRSEERLDRPFVTDEEAQAKDYNQQSIVPSLSETHGGQDVSIYAHGPGAYLMGGVVEQNFIYYVMREAMTAAE